MKLAKRRPPPQSIWERLMRWGMRRKIEIDYAPPPDSAAHGLVGELAALHDLMDQLGGSGGRPVRGAIKLTIHLNEEGNARKVEATWWEAV